MNVNILKKKRFFLLCLIFSSFFLYIPNNSIASEDYVGIKEGDVFIWEDSYNEDLLEDFYEDYFDYLDKYSRYDDEFASAVEVFNNTHLKGLIVTDENDEDWYKIYATVDKNITIFINFTFSYGFDIDAYDQYEEYIGCSRIGVDIVKCVIVTPYTGYYYVNVYYYDENPTTYDIKFNITEPFGDAFEPNNNFYLAPSIYGCFSENNLECSYNDEDFYEYFISSEDMVEIRIEFNNSKGNLDLFLFDETLILLDYSNSSVNNYEQITYTSSITQELYIKVRNNDTLSTNHTYSLMVGDQYCFNDNERDIDELVDDIVEIQGVKFEIEKIKDEKNNKVEIKYERSETKDINDEDSWKNRDDRELTIYDPNDKDFYEDSSLSYIIAIGVDWNEWAEEIKEENEDSEDIDECTVSINFFQNGLTILYEYDDDMDMKDHEFYYEYNSDGVLGLEIVKYDGEQLSLRRLRGYIPPEIVYFSIGGVIFCIIALIALILVNKRRKV